MSVWHGMINTEGVPQDFQKNDSNISESVMKIKQ